MESGGNDGLGVGGLWWYGVVVVVGLMVEDLVLEVLLVCGGGGGGGGGSGSCDGKGDCVCTLLPVSQRTVVTVCGLSVSPRHYWTLVSHAAAVSLSRYVSGWS